MSRVESASGAKYSAHNEQARKFEPIAPVGTNYTPVGKVDIAAMRSAAAPIPPKPAIPSAPRPFGGTVSSSSSSGPTVRTAAVGSAAAASRVPADAWDAPNPTVIATPPPPAAPRPPAVVAGSRPIPAQIVPSSDLPTKPSEEDRIGPVVSVTSYAFSPKGIPIVGPCALYRAQHTHLSHSLVQRSSTIHLKLGRRQLWLPSPLPRALQWVRAVS